MCVTYTRCLQLSLVVLFGAGVALLAKNKLLKRNLTTRLQQVQALCTAVRGNAGLATPLKRQPQKDTLAKRVGQPGRQQPMGRGPAQPSFPSSIGTYGKADGSLKRYEAGSGAWRKPGMRVLLLAVTAAVVGTLLLEHMRLKALTMPQQLVQPVWPASSYPAEPIHPAEHSQLEQHRSPPQQQEAHGSAVHPVPAQQMHEVPADSQPLLDSHLDILPRNR